MKVLSKLLAAVMLLAVASCAFYRPIAVSSNPVGNKRAFGCVTTVLGIFDFGQNNIYTTAQGAGITKISTVDEKYTIYPLGLWTKSCTYISGN